MTEMEQLLWSDWERMSAYLQLATRRGVGVPVHVQFTMTKEEAETATGKIILAEAERLSTRIALEEK